MSPDALRELLGAQVQRIDGPRDDLFVLTLHRSDRHGCLVLGTAPGEVAWGWVAERPRGAPASSFVRLLRKHLENARVTGVEVDSDGARLTMQRGEHEARLCLDRAPANLRLEVDGTAVHALRADGREVKPGAPLADDLFALETIGPALVARAEGGASDARARTLAKALTRRRKQLTRRLKAIETDLDGADEATILRERASLLLTELHRIPDDAREAEVTDWNADPPRPIRIPIDPALGPRRTAERLFRRARKLTRGAEIALERHGATESEIARLDALTQALAGADEEALEGIGRQAARLGARVPSPPGSREHAARTPYRAFRASGERIVMVGRSAADNDALTLHVARPQDHWLHARGVPGSHVVIPLDRNESCPPELLVDAAHLAAHFSDARGESVVEIQHTPRRYVRKPRGAAPGAVTPTREKVLLLRVDAARLTGLLRAEDAV